MYLTSLANLTLDMVCGGNPSLPTTNKDIILFPSTMLA